MKTTLTIIIGTIFCMSLFAKEMPLSPVRLDDKYIVKLDDKKKKVISMFLEDYWRKYKDDEEWKEPRVIAFLIDEKKAMKRFTTRIPSRLLPLPKGEYLEVEIRENVERKPVLGGGTFRVLIDSKSSEILCFGRAK